MKKKTHDVFNILGASNHTDKLRSKNDFYATDPNAVKQLLELETFSDLIWEPACGMGHIANVLENNGKTVKKTDLINYNTDGCESNVNFFYCNEQFDGDIITNPPYDLATEFTEHALDLVTSGHKVAMFLKIQFLETKKRYLLFKKYPPKTIYVSVKRYGCASDGNFLKPVGSAVCYAWFIWEKGYKGDTVVKWFNYD